jgi:hypothetical protein
MADAVFFYPDWIFFNIFLWPLPKIFFRISKNPGQSLVGNLDQVLRFIHNKVCSHAVDHCLDEVGCLRLGCRNKLLQRGNGARRRREGRGGGR